MVRSALADVMAADDRPLTRNDRQRITQEIADDILGYGPLEPYLRDDDVTEVMVNGPFDIWLERKGKLTRSTASSTTRRTCAARSTRSSPASAAASTRPPRWSTPACPTAPVSTPSSRRWRSTAAAHDPEVRRRPADGRRPDRVRHASDRTADFLEACVRGRLNILVSGGTGAGKTTTLNVLSSFIPDDERIVTIEDAAELQLQQDHVVRLESRPANIEGKGEVTIRDLVRNSLRMRPDRIVVGEVRGAEALDMLQAMNTGHDGSISTVHSNSPRDAAPASRRWC